MKKVLFWCSVASAPLGLTQLILILHINRDLGISDYWFTFGDSLVLTVLGQLAFMPILVLAASLCPVGVEGALFATLMSVFNGAGVVGTELGAALTAAFGVTETNFANLAPLVTVCNLSSLLPLLAIGWLDEPTAKGATAARLRRADGGGGGGAEATAWRDAHGGGRGSYETAEEAATESVVIDVDADGDAASSSS